MGRFDTLVGKPGPSRLNERLHDFVGCPRSPTVQSRAKVGFAGSFGACGSNGRSGSGGAGHHKKRDFEPVMLENGAGVGIRRPTPASGCWSAIPFCRT